MTVRTTEDFRPIRRRKLRRSWCVQLSTLHLHTTQRGERIRVRRDQLLIEDKGHPFADGKKLPHGDCLIEGPNQLVERRRTAGGNVLIYDHVPC
jgi:hypothetical protein